MPQADEAAEQATEESAPGGETTQIPATSDNPSGPGRYATRQPSPIVNSLGFALIGALMTIQPLAATTFLKLFYEKSPELIQPALPEDLPLPISLVWPPRLYGAISTLGTLTSAAVLGLYIAFSLCGLYALFRILNPTFRVTTGVDWDRHLLVKTYMHGEPVTKAFLISIAVVIPAFVVWQLLGWAIGENAFSLWLRLALSGATLWFLYSREGVAGDYESGSYEPPREPGVRRSLLIRGLLAGTVVWLALRLTPLLRTSDLFSAFRAVGYIGPGQWWQIALITVGFAAMFGFTLGGLFTALGAPGWQTGRRARVAILPALILVAAAYGGRIWLPAHFAAKFDYVAGSMVPAESRLAKACRLSLTPAPRTAWLLDTDRALPVQFSGLSVTGIAATPENGRAIATYLDAHVNRTALSYAAYTTLHDTALLEWSVDDALRVYLRNLSGAPDMAYVSHLLNKLQGTAFSPTPGVIAAVDRLADDRFFDYTDRRAWVLVGDIYARFGLRAKAEGCYRKAEMPASQVAIRADERTLSPDGKVVGKLLVGGRPAAGAKVGLMAERAVEQAGFMTDASTHLTSPFWLSWIGASTTTDSQGRFAMDRLLYGRYVLLVQLPGPLDTAAAAKPAAVSNGPATITVRTSAPPVDLGTITITPPAR